MSFVRERQVVLGDRVVRLGMARPSTTEDGWWLAVAWVADEAGVVPWDELAPSAAASPVPPLARIGPLVSGFLSGLIVEQNGRLGIRLGPIVPPPDAAQPWRAPAAIRAAFLFEPVRAAAIPPNELAATVVDALAGALESLARPQPASRSGPIRPGA